jgi:hypothetical protein
LRGSRREGEHTGAAAEETSEVLRHHHNPGYYDKPAYRIRTVWV